VFDPEEDFWPLAVLAGLALAWPAWCLCRGAFLGVAAALDFAQNAGAGKRGTINPLARSNAMICFMTSSGSKEDAASPPATAWRPGRRLGASDDPEAFRHGVGWR
jgi:hypothetical protein